MIANDEHKELDDENQHMPERRQGREAAVLTFNLELEKLDSVTNELLKKIRARISNRLRASDVVVQVEGNEFVVLLKDIRSPDNANTISEDLIKIITEPFELCTQIAAKIDLPESKIKVGVTFLDNSNTISK